MNEQNDQTRVPYLLGALSVILGHRQIDPRKSAYIFLHLERGPVDN